MLSSSTCTIIAMKYYYLTSIALTMLVHVLLINNSQKYCPEVLILISSQPRSTFALFLVLAALPEVLPSLLLPELFSNCSVDSDWSSSGITSWRVCSSSGVEDLYKCWGWGWSCGSPSPRCVTNGLPCRWPSLNLQMTCTCKRWRQEDFSLIFQKPHIYINKKRINTNSLGNKISRVCVTKNVILFTV